MLRWIYSAGYLGWPHYHHPQTGRGWSVILGGPHGVKSLCLGYGWKDAPSLVLRCPLGLADVTSRSQGDKTCRTATGTQREVRLTKWKKIWMDGWQHRKGFCLSSLNIVVFNVVISIQVKSIWLEFISIVHLQTAELHQSASQENA